MATSRPFECPACGHEGIVRAPDSETAAGRAEAGTDRWTCRLCGYTWSRPAPRIRSGEVDPIIP